MKLNVPDARINLNTIKKKKTLGYVKKIIYYNEKLMRNDNE